MAADDDREQNFERALTRHLRNVSDHSSCPDAEILAAYHERMLSLEAMAHWQEHISTCSRCQESLALVEQTEHLPREEWEPDHVLHPVEQRAASRSARLSASFTVGEGAPSTVPASFPETTASPIHQGRAHVPWRWVAPLGLAAAAVIAWVGLQEVKTHGVSQLQKSAAQIAENRAPSPSAPALQTAPTDKSNRDRSSSTLPREQSSPRVGLSAPSASAPSAALSVRVKPTGQLPPPERNNNVAPRSLSDSELRRIQPSAPVAGYVEKEESADQVAQLKSDLDAVEKKRAETPPAPASGRTVEGQAPPANKAAAQVASYQNQFAATLLTLAKVDPHYVVAPGHMQAWRLGTGGLIEHSTNAGKNWNPQASGVTSDLTGGFAPSDKVCWVVGKAGALLVTADGGNHWKSLTSPTVVDLGGVHATDAMHASVWDASNRNSFETADGGATWTRIANE